MDANPIAGPAVPFDQDAAVEKAVMDHQRRLIAFHGDCPDVLFTRPNPLVEEAELALLMQLTLVGFERPDPAWQHVVVGLLLGERRRHRDPHEGDGKERAVHGD